MGYPSPDKLVAAWKVRGLQVIEHRRNGESWRTNGFGLSTWNPQGVVVHDAGGNGSTAGLIDFCWDRNGDYSSAVYSGIVGKERDQANKVHLLGFGPTNHGGRPIVRTRDLLKAGDMPLDRTFDARDSDPRSSSSWNRIAYGFCYAGMGPRPDYQRATMLKVVAGICDAHGWDQDGWGRISGHKEGVPSKVDPNHPMHEFRRDIRKMLVPVRTSPPTLRHGDTDATKGGWVSKLQKRMTTWYASYNNYPVTGQFGDRTQAGVKEFQRRTNLVADGVVGEATWKKLDVWDED